MPAITANRTCVVIADKISNTNIETVRLMLIQICSFIENVEILDFYENDKLQKYIESEEIPVVKIMDSWTCKDWDSTFKHFKVVLTHYRNVIIINSPTLRYMNEDPVKVLKRYEDKVTLDASYVFDSKGKQIRDRMMRLLFIKASSGSFGRNNVYQFVTNPNEFDYRELWNFKHYKRIGPWNWKNTEIGPTYEFAMSHIYIQKILKTQDLFWYASCYNKPNVKELYDIVKIFLNRRSWTQPFLNPVYGECGVFDKGEYKKCSKPQDEYFYNLMCSKYTIISETDDGSFPIVRFMEAIILGCIPILQSIIDYNVLKSDLTDQVFYDIIKWKNLVMKEFKFYRGSSHYTKGVHTVSERFKVHYGEDMDVIELLRKSQYYKYMTSERYVSDYYTKLLSGAKYPKRKGGKNGDGV